MIQTFFWWGGGGGRGGGSGSLSPPRLNIFTVGNMGAMICLSQGSNPYPRQSLSVVLSLYQPGL